ncbi:FAD-dependent monooxygenase [Streptomyces hydrogenans]|uniref:FAD-dependent monooxygenase n=1 Tax=Streptomyces hydrogenans TaxID=1873719 RepID=UPI00278C89BE|nr:FAD-dependent monooxygenase [Streptomyces hydrogenans]
MWGKVAVVGGGPAGLFLARLIRGARPDARVDVYERNAPHEANGFGVVFSARTMSRLRRSDPETHARIVRASVTVSDMELRHPRATLRYGGFDFSSISRQTLLTILQEQAASAGAVLHFGHHAAPGSLDDADVVVYADGANSAQRDARPERFGTTVRYGASPYMWLGTEAPFDAATFAFVATGHGHFAAHAYPYAEGLTTVVVETDPATWQASGMDRPADHARNPGGSDEASLERLSELFADHLGGHKLLGNRSRWATFRIVRNARWSDGNAVLLGDAAHTAHFTVGSGTKLAMEDAIALAAALDRDGDPRAAFAAYERERRALVTRTQEWAEPSMRWWETFGRRLHMAPAQFGLHFMTRTSALTYEGLRRRFADRVDEAEEAYRTAGGTAARPGAAPGPAHGVAAPLLLGSVRLPNRLIEVVPEECDDPAAAVRAAGARGAGLVLLRGAGTVPRPDVAVGSVLRPERGGGAAARETAARTAPLFAEVACPAADAWGPAGDELTATVRALVARGCEGVLLTPDPAPSTDRAPGSRTDSAPGPAAGTRTDPGTGPGSPTGTAVDTRIDPGTAAGTRTDPGIGSPADSVPARAAGTRTGPVGDPAARWHALLGHAERVRTETGAVVAVPVPDGWALDLPGSTGGDAWPTRIHLALVTGRIDLVVSAAPTVTRPAVPAAG